MEEMEQIDVKLEEPPAVETETEKSGKSNRN
jgi:hypothetical protein